MGRRKQPKLRINKNCHYCGEPATCYDHVIPYSLVGHNTLLVPACDECNGLLGARLFQSLGEKKSFIARALAKRHAVDLRMRVWTETEIMELGYTLRTVILAGLENANRVRRRIAHASSM